MSLCTFENVIKELLCILENIMISYASLFTNTETVDAYIFAGWFGNTQKGQRMTGQSTSWTTSHRQKWQLLAICFEDDIVLNSLERQWNSDGHYCSCFSGCMWSLPAMLDEREIDWMWVKMIWPSESRADNSCKHQVHLMMIVLKMKFHLILCHPWTVKLGWK